MEPLDDRHWLEPPDDVDEERADRDRRLEEDADLHYKEQQDEKANA